MTRIKNWIKLVAVTIITTLVVVFFIKKDLITPNMLILDNNDYLYNTISLAAVIGGFLFTGIGILISAIDKDVIKLFWINNYLDNLYRASFLGLICNVITIIIALIILMSSMGDEIVRIMMNVQTIVIALGLVYFVWCIKELLFIVTKLKQDMKKDN